MFGFGPYFVANFLVRNMYTSSLSQKQTARSQALKDLKESLNTFFLFFFPTECSYRIYDAKHPCWPRDIEYKERAKLDLASHVNLIFDRKEFFAILLGKGTENEMLRQQLRLEKKINERKSDQREVTFSSFLDCNKENSTPGTLPIPNDISLLNFLDDEMPDSTELNEDRASHSQPLQSQHSERISRNFLETPELLPDKICPASEPVSDCEESSLGNSSGSQDSDDDPDFYSTLLETLKSVKNSMTRQRKENRRLRLRIIRSFAPSNVMVVLYFFWVPY